MAFYNISDYKAIEPKDEKFVTKDAQTSGLGIQKLANTNRTKI